MRYRWTVYSKSPFIFRHGALKWKELKAHISWSCKLPKQYKQFTKTIANFVWQLGWHKLSSLSTEEFHVWANCHLETNAPDKTGSGQVRPRSWRWGPRWWRCGPGGIRRQPAGINTIKLFWTVVNIGQDFDALCEMLSEFSSGHICACQLRIRTLSSVWCKRYWCKAFSA